MSHVKRGIICVMISALSLPFVSTFAVGKVLEDKGQRALPAPPPISLLPLSSLDPLYSLPPERWRSAICLSWNDGCRKCQRTTLAGRVTCGELRLPNLNCAPSFTACNAFDDGALLRSCSQVMVFEFSRKEFNPALQTAEEFLNKHDAGTYSNGVQFNKSTRKWDKVSSLDVLITHRTKLSFDETAYRCVATYSHEYIRSIIDDASHAD
jgi:hypothetical protein